MNGFPRHPGRRQPQGVSLVVVVALVGLLTLLTVSLLTLVTFSRQTNVLEAESRSGEMLAQAAFNTVLADLTDEMDQGAAGVKESRLDDGTKLRRYDFTNKPAGLTVSRALKAGAFSDTSLVKQSASGVRFHRHGGSATQRASAESTAAGAEPLEPEVWSKPRLLDAAVDFSAATVPDWIYVARDGSNPVAFSADLKQRETAAGSNPKFVIGRYAFNLYDTSGLLDINAAGHPADQPGPERVGHKGSLALADLAGLPGMSADGVTELARWKHNWSSVAAVGDLPPGTTAMDDYIRRSEGTGWQVLAANDNLFLSRQDLLRFAKLRPKCLPESTLPLLSHFSRDLDAPSWMPHPKRPKVATQAAKGGNDAYKADDEVNPDLMGFSKLRQTFLLQRRFPLERLRWVATPGRDGPLDPAKAERYFGLRWANDHWVYTHARSNGDLHTLQDVPAGREPDFFEILRAAVLCGSLGRQYGATGFAAGSELLNWSHKLGGIDGSINLNILEMGACLIDQADPDGFPTAISLRGATRDYWAFGKEDVPYLYRTIAVPYRAKRLAAKVYYDNGALAPTETYEVAMTLQVGLWRPHQPNQVAASGVPEKFRIRPQHVDLFGGSMFYLQGGWRVPGKTGGVPYPPAEIREGDYSYWGGPNYRLSNPELFPKTFDGSEFIEVAIPNGSTAFREPQTLHSEKHAQNNGYTATGATVAVMPDDLRWAGLPSGYRSVFGFLVGRGMTARMEAENGPSGVHDGSRLGQGFFRGEPIEFLLEYQAEDGSWRPYQRAEFSYFSTFSRHFAREPHWKSAAWQWGSFLIDPRTARFGGIGGTHQGWTQANNPIGAPQTGPDAFAPRLHWPEGAAMRWESVQTVTFEGTQLYSGVWSWWRQPAKNTGWNYNSDVEWWMNMNHAGCLENDDKAWKQPFTLAYLDPDGVLRQGVGADNLYGKTILGNPMSRRHTINLSTGKLTASASQAGRPRILNRLFRSVGELAYAFRGTPWRDIDFLRGSSPDAGLLDAFSLYEDPAAAPTADPAAEAMPPVVAGRVNLNTAKVEVIAALLRGTAVDEGRYLSESLANQLAKEVYEWLHASAAGKGPLLSKAGLVGSAVPDAAAKGLIYQLSTRLTDDDDKSINDRREVAVRALADGTTVRAWNFMLDLVVQTGQLTPGATSLGQFQTAAERRFWVHFAIDRPTGQVIAVQWEPVVD